VNPTLEETAQPQAPRAGFALPRDIIIAPARAFAAIKRRPEWLPAAIVVLLLSIAGTVLVAPALAHLTNAQVAASRSNGANIPDSLVDAAVKQELAVVFFNQTIMQLAAWGLTAMVLTTAARLRGQTTTFATYFSLAANCSIPLALGFVVDGIVIRMHDPAGFASLNQFNRTVPLTLAVLDPHGTTERVAFLAQYDVFFLWAALLVAYGYVAISGEKLIRALFLALGVAFAFSLLTLVVQQ